MQYMEKEGNYSAALPGNFSGLDDNLDRHHQHLVKHQLAEIYDNGKQLVDYMPNDPQQQPNTSSGFCSSTLSFTDVMQFLDSEPKLAIDQATTSDEETGIDPAVFNERFQDDQPVVFPQQHIGEDEDRVRVRFHGDNGEKSPVTGAKTTKRKRPRTTKTSEEVESQRMIHIAVERNRRKQMNEHLRVLRSLMPGSYVQRGDQASIIGGAIEFVRELEQLLQCLESQKRRRIYGDGPGPIGDSSVASQQTQPPFLASMPLPNETGLEEEIAESKSCLADIEVKLLGFDAMIKILSRRRPGQLIKIMAALEDVQLNILHTNITTLDQTVLYSLNVKVGGDARYTAEDIANSVQQIFSFIHANNSVCM